MAVDGTAETSVFVNSLSLIHIFKRDSEADALDNNIKMEIIDSMHGYRLRKKRSKEKVRESIFKYNRFLNKNPLNE